MKNLSDLAVWVRFGSVVEFILENENVAVLNSRLPDAVAPDVSMAAIVEQSGCRKY